MSILSNRLPTVRQLQCFVDEAHRLLVGLDEAVASLRDDAGQQQENIRLGLTSVMDFSQFPALNALLSEPLFNHGIQRRSAPTPGASSSAYWPRRSIWRSSVFSPIHLPPSRAR